MQIPKPRPLSPPKGVFKKTAPVPEAGVFNLAGQDRILAVRLGVDAQSGEILAARSVVEGRVMTSVARTWVSADRIGDLWGLVSGGLEFDWCLLIVEAGQEFLLGNIGAPESCLWADTETMMAETRSGFMARLAPGKPKVDEGVLKVRKDIDFSSNANGAKIKAPEETYMIVPKDLEGLPKFRNVLGEVTKQETQAWTDGSYIRRGCLRGASVVTSHGYWVATNSKGKSIEHAEIYAILLAIANAIRTRSPKTTINSDSKAALRAVDLWLKGDQGSVKFRNTEIIKTLNRIVFLMDKYPVEFEFKWVKGHAGESGNEAADRLARLTARRSGIGMSGVTDEEARGILEDTGVINKTKETL